MKKLPSTRTQINSFSSLPEARVFSLMALFVACCSFWAQAQCPADITVTGSTSAGATGTWTAPASGGPWVVRITATGAGGGGNNGDSGGSGATLSGVVVVPNGKSLFLIAGGPGENPGTDNDGGGGGGASGVVLCDPDCANGTILLIAAGGNGAEGSNDGLGGSAATGGGGAGGAGGGANGGGGGGGLNSPGGNGGSPGFGGSQVSKTTISLGGQGNDPDGGGTNDNDGGNGMGAGGGGGSSSSNGSGGGGGHTGAAGGNSLSATSFFDVFVDLEYSTNGTKGGGSNSGQVIVKCLGAQNTQCNGQMTTITGPVVQDWTAPATGGPFTVYISATGGSGGGNAVNQGGTGATMTGTFVVQNGETLKAIAGGAGGSGDDTHEGGGGGGSGVVKCVPNCAGGTILIIAAGGSGAEGNIGQGGLSATTGSGGGGGGCNTNNGGGGGGFSSPGCDSGGSGGGDGGGQVSKTALSAGGTGSNPGVNDGGAGMGGGGGGGTDDNGGAGGGGGHTGGNASNPANPNIRPRSYFDATGSNPAHTDGVQGAGPANGLIIIKCLGSLPVELINFKALIRENQTVDLLWATATEKNNHGFDVERSADNKNWKTLGFVQGNGTTAERHDYTFTDTEPLQGVNYYRLKQLDFDGKHEYSPMVVADVRGGGLQFDVFPNPSVDGELSFRIVSETEGNAELEIYDWVGYKVYRESVQLLKGTMIYPISLATFPKGTYTARLQMPDGQVYFKKVVLQ
jgi:hypothetical protein